VNPPGVWNLKKMEPRYRRMSSAAARHVMFRAELIRTFGYDAQVWQSTTVVDENAMASAETVAASMR
jgi:hypothetical protein